MASRQSCGTGKLVDDCLIQPSAAAFLIQVVLRDSDQVSLSIDIKSEFASYASQQCTPVHIPGGS